METNNTLIEPEVMQEQHASAKLKDSIYQHSSGIEDIISARQPLIVRRGTAYFSLLLAFVCFACWLIEYPQLVTAKSSLSSINAPKQIVSRADGKLMKILVKENDTVKENQILGYMESIADPNAILQVANSIDSISKLIRLNKTNEIEKYFPNAYGSRTTQNLGELQAPYQVFIQSFIIFKDYLQTGYFLRKREMLEQDMRNIQKLHAVLLEQKLLLEQDVSLSDETFSANETLVKEKVISPLDYRNEKSKLIAKKLSLPQVNSSIISNEGQQNEKRKEIAELENQISIEKNKFIQALETIRTQIQSWDYKYLLKAPVSGKVSFIGFFQENQEVKNQQPLFYVEPQNTSYYVEMLISQFNFGKVKAGQDVLLKFQAYPFEQYGSVIGKIEFISSVPSDSGYLAKVSLPEGLKTNYGKELYYRNGLLAQADIVTEKMRLIEVFYYNLIKQFKRS